MNDVKAIPYNLSILRAWILAARPKTLTAAVIPFLVGTCIASSEGYSISLWIMLAAIMCSMAVQVGTNLVNDAFDFARGADTAERLGPPRATQTGLLTMQQVYFGGMIALSFALLLGVPLVWKSGLPILMVLLLSITAGYLYTGGPFPLAYYGLGDFFVLLFFGITSTLSAYYLQTGTLSATSLLAGTQIGLLATVIIAINNCRDIEQDAKAEKTTLAVLLGLKYARIEIMALIMTAYILNFFWFLRGNFWASALPFFTLPLAIFIIRGIRKFQPSSTYNVLLSRGALLHFLFGILLIVGILLK